MSVQICENVRSQWLRKNAFTPIETIAEKLCLFHCNSENFDFATNTNVKRFDISAEDRATHEDDHVERTNKRTRMITLKKRNNNGGKREILCSQYSFTSSKQVART